MGNWIGKLLNKAGLNKNKFEERDLNETNSGLYVPALCQQNYPAKCVKSYNLN